MLGFLVATLLGCQRTRILRGTRRELITSIAYECPRANFSNTTLYEYEYDGKGETVRARTSAICGKSSLLSKFVSYDRVGHIIRVVSFCSLKSKNVRLNGITKNGARAIA